MDVKDTVNSLEVKPAQAADSSKSKNQFKDYRHEEREQAGGSRKESSANKGETAGAMASTAPAAAEWSQQQQAPFKCSSVAVRAVEEYEILNCIAEGSYGIVYRARNKKTDEIVALKRLKFENDKERFPITSLREIDILFKLSHPNIVKLREVVVGSTMSRIFIVMDFVEHDLKSLMEMLKHKKRIFLPAEVKCLTHQLLLAVAHLHDNWILHRDLKTSNLLFSHKGILKVRTSAAICLMVKSISVWLLRLQILDWHVSTNHRLSRTQRSLRHWVIEPPSYCSAAICTRHQSICGRSDVFLPSSSPCLICSLATLRSNI